MSIRHSPVVLASATLCFAIALAGCTARTPQTGSQPSPTVLPSVNSAGPGQTPSRGASTGASEAAPSSIPEPTTTNTLPPPPEPTKPAPSRAGPLTGESLPVPVGWHRVARDGGVEEGYLGNGTWIHARDARYAAHDVITLGCASVTRDDYTDPTHALEGSYERSGQPGVGLVLQFRTAGEASSYFQLYRSQVAACENASDPVRTKLVSSPTGLIDRRTYPDGQWTEVANSVGPRLVLILLSDPGHQISAAAAQQILAQIGS